MYAYIIYLFFRPSHQATMNVMDLADFHTFIPRAVVRRPSSIALLIRAPQRGKVTGYEVSNTQ